MSAAVSSAPGAVVLITGSAQSKAPKPQLVSRGFASVLGPLFRDIGDEGIDCRQVGAVATSLRGRLRAVLCTKMCLWNCDR